MTSKERVLAAINHQQPDRVPIDLGACNTTGIGVSALHRLRKYLGLPEKELEAYEIMQMLGTVEDDVRRLIGGDVVGLNNPTNVVGIPMKGPMKRFVMPDGTPVRIHAANEYDIAEDGRIYMYPQGNRNVAPVCSCQTAASFLIASTAPPNMTRTT